MTDPRNIADDKRLLSDKKHHDVASIPGTHSTLRPGKKQRVDPAPNGHEHGPDSDGPIDKNESGVEPGTSYAGRDSRILRRRFV